MRPADMTDTTTPADRDFELRWRSAEAAPTVGLFRERVRNTDYLMAVIAPPAAAVPWAAVSSSTFPATW